MAKQTVEIGDTGDELVSKLSNNFTEVYDDIGTLETADTNILSDIADVDIKVKVIYVNGTTGNDSNAGTSAAPLKTIKKACETIADSKRAKVVIAAGTYRGTAGVEMAWSNFTDGDYEFIADKIAKVRILGSEALSSFSKTDGATNVYEASWGGSVLTYSNVLAAGDSVQVIFEDGRESKAITDPQALQRGLSNRLPYTALHPQTSIANCDANAGSFYFDDANNKIYIHPSDSDNPSTNGYSYEISLRGCNSSPASYHVNLKLTGIQFLFAYLHGCDLTGFNNVERKFCSVFGARSTGFFDGAAKVVSWKDEAGGNYSDGFGSDIAHITDYDLEDMRTAYTLGIYHDPWSHDNGDDGISQHRRGEISIYGGLFEYNGDNGVIPAYGCNCNAYNVISRQNSQLTGNNGSGFTAQGTADAGRSYVIMNLFNCYSEGNKYGFNAGGPNIINCFNCLSVSNTTYEYIKAGTGVITLNNCKYYNADPGKDQSGATIIAFAEVT